MDGDSIGSSVRPCAKTGETAASKTWPKDARALSGKLRRIGISIDFEREPGGTRSHFFSAAKKWGKFSFLTVPTIPSRETIV
jgi:hypothetical protein